MRVIAHRGASEAAPENTLAAFALARRMGASGLEVDVQATADRRLVIFHDPDTERLCGVPGRVRAMTLAELRRLRVAGEHPIPTLEELLATEDRPASLILELKSYRWHDLAVADLLGRYLRRTRAHERTPIVVSAFHPVALLKLKRHVPEVPRALLMMRGLRLPLRDGWSRRLVGAGELHLHAALVERARVTAAHQAGRAVIAWTVNDPEQALALRELGVDGVMTDAPDRILAALGQRPAPPAVGDGPRRG
ncbi:MAG: glycerophosphoryl diester phosphodiesterase [Planctomycetota bacterium]|nr:MAG: glycerophosphoryl diester phosphodiesterase [Planctomycetota bacterium]